jgi:hypothetical protein
VITAEPVFEKRSVRDVLSRVVLKGSWKPPADADLEQLVADLNGFRKLVWLNRGAFKESRQRSIAVGEAVTILSKNLPKMLEEARPTAADFGMIMSIAEHARNLETLYNAVSDIGATNWFLMEFGPFDRPLIEEWKHVAPGLADILRDALAGANPTKTLRNSNGGPIARFIAHVLPHITGDSLAPETISAFLKRQ